MKKIIMKFEEELIKVKFPNETEVFLMSPPRSLINPIDSIKEALHNSIGSPSLDQIIEKKVNMKPQSKAVVVISDNTRPIPYRGEKGILWPIIEKLLSHNIPPEHILILVATGTHRPLSEGELHKMLDSRVFKQKIPIKNHNCRDKKNLIYLGKTNKDNEIYVNRNYIESDIKILTGLVESHFITGVSGGRKSICPGLMGEESINTFHSAQMLNSLKVGNLIIQGNPCNDESLKIAKKAGVDYIINITLDHELNLTGVFAGDLEKAHQQAVKQVKKYVIIPINKEYDIVITHAGFVGINHYQAAKAAVISIPVLKSKGYLIMVAHNKDIDLIGSPNYRAVLHLLKLIGAKRFNHLILSPDWSFIPEQWQVQMWARLFLKISQKNFLYYSPGISSVDYNIIPGKDGNLFLPPAKRYRKNLKSISRVIEKAVEEAIKELMIKGQRKISIAYLSNGPCGVPVKRF